MNDPDLLPDVARIRAGLALLALDAPEPRAPRRRGAAFVAAAAVAALLALGIAVAVDDPPSRPVATPPSVAPPTGGAQIGMPAPSRDLVTKVNDATRVVVGRVTGVHTGTLGTEGDAYVLATVEVDEAVKGDGGTLVAFAYEYGTTAIVSSGSTRPWQVGDRVLLFLVPDVGTASSDIEPAHLFVDGGESGRYLFEGDRLDAPFTLDEVRAAAR